MEKAFELVKLEPYEVARSISCWKMPKNPDLLGFTKDSLRNSRIFTKYEQILVGAPKIWFLTKKYSSEKKNDNKHLKPHV